MNASAELSRLISEPGLLVVPGVYDGVSAAMVRESKFSAAYMSGAAVAASAVGVPDIGLATMSEMVAQAAVITGQLRVPLIADADTGFGDVTNAYRTVLEYERVGVAAIQLEDQVFPKRCGHLDGKQIVDQREFIDKIGAALDARDSMLIVAQTDAIATHGIDEALRRANAYAESGADVIFVEAPQTVDEIALIPKAIDAPVLFNLVPHGRSPFVTLDQLEDFGYSAAICPGTAIAGAASGIRGALAGLARGEVNRQEMVSPRGFFEIVDFDFWENIRLTFDVGGSSA